MADGDGPGRDDRYDWLYDSRPGQGRSRTRSRSGRRQAPGYPAGPPATSEPAPDPTRRLRTEPSAGARSGSAPDEGYADSPRRGAGAHGERRRTDRGAGTPPRPPSGRAAPAGRRRPRGRRRFPVVRLLLLLLAVYLVFLVAVPVLAWNRVTKVDAAPDAERPPGGAGTNYLLVGSDSREGLTPEERNELGTGSAGGRRTDTIMLLHVPDGLGPPVLVSLPRDSYVPIPGHDGNKINAAFSFGGPELLVDTVENVTGLRVDEYVEIGFGGFVEVVDSLDGVEMCLPEAIQDDKAHVDLPAGCQMLAGVDALGYVRMRYADPRGDLGRVERQQQFLNAVVKRAATPATLLNPVRYWGFGMASGDALTAGEETGVFDMARFALAMRAVSSGAGVAMTVPIESTSYDSPAGSAVKWDSEQALALFEALESGADVPAELLPESDTSGQ